MNSRASSEWGLASDTGRVGLTFAICDPVTFYVSGIRPRLLHLSSIITVCSEYTLTVITLCSITGIIWLLGCCIGISQFACIIEFVLR